MLQQHYAEEHEHAICDLSLVTTLVFTCSKCNQHFPTLNKRDMHSCPDGQVPPSRHLDTDGSGGQDNSAGWALVVYAEPLNARRMGNVCRQSYTTTRNMPEMLQCG